MERKNSKLFIILAIALFAVIFAVLLTVATLYDLDISKIMTKKALPAGQYFSDSGFGLFFESVGSAPIYIMAAIAGVVGFWWGLRKDNKYLKIIVPLIGAVVIFLGLFFFVKDIFRYVGEHMHNKEYMSNGYVVCLEIMLTLIIGVLLTLTWKQIKPENNDKLIIWVAVILGTVALYLIVHFIKTPIGRMRYRAMNCIGDTEFTGYTRWYVVNGPRNLVPRPDGVSVSDSCKSFPSGHTYSAALVYTLLCLPDLLETWNKKWVKISLYVGTIGFTGIVAISRIVVGAHYMSDVLFGGTLSFLAMVIFREIFIFKGSHFKNLFGLDKNKATLAVETANGETTEAVVESSEEEQ